MSTTECFETKVMIAAEEARRAGFIQTHAALLDVLRASRCSDERMIGSLSTAHPAMSLRSSLRPNLRRPPHDFTNG